MTKCAVRCAICHKIIGWHILSGLFGVCSQCKEDMK